MVNQDFITQTKHLIDELKKVCTDYGLGNDGNEFKIITQVFLYKFLNDKFSYEIKKLDPTLDTSDNWEKKLASYSDNDYDMLLMRLNASTAKLKREHLLSYLYNRQNQEKFAQLFDDTLRDISIFNNDIFSVKTGSGAKITLFDELSQFITDSTQRDNFCRAIISKLVNFSFEPIFSQKYDFFATIFEYLIKDYNKDGGSKYAEYYTPHAVAKIMASILVPDNVSNVTVYDPAAGSGTLLMSLAHAIGEDRCTIYSQDISQKSSGMLRLNLILNNLVHSIQNVIQGNTITEPFHRAMKFDYIVSNPPFKLDFSDYRDSLDAKENRERFFAGIPKIPEEKKEKMPIYLLFIQHILYSLTGTGKAAIVVPTGFLTAQNGIERKIHEELIDKKMLRGVISMPSNIFATTGTNVSILFVDKANTTNEIILMEASKLGLKTKDGNNQRTILSPEEEQLIINTFNQHSQVENFSVLVSNEKIKEKNYSFSPGQYFDVKVDYTDISQDEFTQKMKNSKKELDDLFIKSKGLDDEIRNQLELLIYESHEDNNPTR